MPDKKIIEARRMLLTYLGAVAQANNITHEQIAEKCGWQRSAVSRMLASRYSPGLDQLLKLCEALDVQIHLADNNKAKADDVLQLWEAARIHREPKGDANKN